jgi:3-keto-disaccharide hydrolase
MKRRYALAGLFFVAAIAFGQIQTASGEDGWVTLFDGKNLDHFDKVGDANWRIEDGAAVADRGNGFLVTRDSYGDFQIRAEFWVGPDANSGIFIRATEPQKIDSKTAYEVNIWDDRPNKDYATGAIVDVAKVDPMPKSVGQWNVYEITAKGGAFTVVLNGQKTVEAKDSKHASGKIALQHGLGNKDAVGVVNDKGVVKFRKVEIKKL